jgi:hypothetical protein
MNICKFLFNTIGFRGGDVCGKGKGGEGGCPSTNFSTKNRNKILISNPIGPL